MHKIPGSQYNVILRIIKPRVCNFQKIVSGKSLKLSSIKTIMFNCSGEGKTKQSAKKNAALHMYNHFKNLVPEKIVTPHYGEYQSSMKSLINNNLPIEECDSKQKTIITHSDVLKSLETFIKTLKSSNKSGLNRLQVIYLIQFNPIKLSSVYVSFFFYLQQIDFAKPFNISAVDILEQIGKEEGFEIKYALVSNKSTKSI